MCIYRHPLSENEKFCYKPQNNPSVTILLNWVDAFQMNNIMFLPSFNILAYCKNILLSPYQDVKTSPMRAIPIYDLGSTANNG